MNIATPRTRYSGFGCTLLAAVAISLWVDILASAADVDVSPCARFAADPRETVQAGLQVSPEILRGLPKGFRVYLVDINFEGPAAESPSPGRLAEVQWSPDRLERPEQPTWNVVFRGIRLLQVTPSCQNERQVTADRERNSRSMNAGPASTRSTGTLLPDHRGARAWIALSPGEAERLTLLHASGQMRMRMIVRGDNTSLGDDLETRWTIETIEDRTDAVESGLAEYASDPALLQRPTLAPAAASGPARPRDIFSIRLKAQVSPPWTEPMR